MRAGAGTYARLTKISDEWLRNAYAGFPEEIVSDFGRRHFTLWTAILARIFGREWVERHVLNPNSSEAIGFLKLDFSADQARERKSLRLGLLAEMLLNLQNVPGFEHPVAQMRNGQIESGFAELEFGKLLYVNDIEFRFVDPRGRKKGEAYDFELTYPDGVIVCADAKCKLEGSQPNLTSLKHSLRDASRQLPKNRPSVIFVKVPQHWIETSGVYEAMGDETRRFLNGTKRIVSVKYYSSMEEFRPDGILLTHQYREISNPGNRFDTTRDWALFQSPSSPTSAWNGLPPKWKRLIRLPDGPLRFDEHDQ